MLSYTGAFYAAHEQQLLARNSLFLSIRMTFEIHEIFQSKKQPKFASV